jgi:glycine reductase
VESRPEAVGPGRAINQFIGNRGEVAATMICGDNYFTENREVALKQIVELVREAGADALIAGPAFNAGRYGMACGEICQAVQRELGIPAVSAMFKENPGVELYHQDVYIVETGDSVRDMAEAVKKMVGIITRLGAGQPIGLPAEEGYFPMGIVRNEPVEATAASRAVDMVLAKIAGREVRPELELPKFDRVSPANLAVSLSEATIALATDGGLVPKGNPDNMESNRSTRFAAYSIAGLDSLSPEEYEANHMGFDTALVNEDPNRLVPVDALRSMEREGRIGKLHEEVFTTAGVATALKNAELIARGMAEAMKAHGIDAVILTST